jgi:hypothetical protein
VSITASVESASGAVAVDFLNPFEVDNRDNADLQVRILASTAQIRFKVLML